MIRKKKKHYQKPDKKEKATVYPFNDNKQFDIVTRRHSGRTPLSDWVRIEGNKMFNKVTGEEREYKRKEKRKSNSVFGGLKVGYRTIKNTFKGKKHEYIFVFGFITQVTDINYLNKEMKSIIEKLKRRFGEIIFIRVLIYYEEYQPIIHIWIQKVDNTEIETTVKELETLWGNGTAKIIKVTKNNVDSLASYYNNEYINKEMYPTGIKVWSTSSNIEKIEPIEDIDHEQAEEITKGCNLIYGKSMSFEDATTGEELQYITYESYYKPETIGIRKLTVGTKYKGTIVKDYKKKQEEKANKNFAEIEKLTEDKSCWFEVTRLDTDLCKITVKRTGKEFKTTDTKQTLRLVKYLLKKK